MRSFPFLGNQEQCVGFNLFSTFLYFPHLVISPIDTLWVTEKSTVGPLSALISLQISCMLISLSTSPSFQPLASSLSSTLAWQIPWMEEPGGLQSMESRRVGLDWATSLSLFTFLHWRRKWQPTPVFLPGESQGRGSLVGCRFWGCKESDMTEAT